MYNTRSLAFRTFEFEPKGEILYAQDVSGRTFPAYTVVKTKISKSQLQIARIVGPQTMDIGMFKLHSFSSKVDVSVHGFNTLMKTKSSLSGTHHFNWPPYGNMQWKQSLSGSKMQLYDGAGRQVAAAKIGYRSCRIEIWTPGDDYFVDMVIATAVAKIKQQQKEIKDSSTGADVVSSVLSV